jgi:hypothetical protein
MLLESRSERQLRRQQAMELRVRRLLRYLNEMERQVE